jgi:protein-arginine kinase activator protein McsA
VRGAEQSRAVQLNQKKPQVRSEVCNFCSVVTETFGVQSLFGVTQCYNYSKIKSVIINCNSAWRIPNKSSDKSITHKLFVALPGKPATITLYLLVGIQGESE